MDDLIAFLRARLDDDELQAQAAGGGSWRRQDHPSDTVAIYDLKGEPVVYDEGSPTEEQAAHIVRHDPARVLAEVDANRRILALHEPVILRAGGGAAYFGTTRVCRSCEPPKQFPETAYPCATLRLLALPYATHPDYQDTWRP